MARVPQFITAAVGVGVIIPASWNDIAIIPGAGGTVTITSSLGGTLVVSQPIVLGGGGDNSFDNQWAAITLTAGVANAQIIVNGDVALGGGGTGASNLSGYIPYVDTNYTSVKANGTATANGAALLAAIASAKLLTPNGSALSATNRAVVAVLPGTYNTGSTAITLTQFVDIIGWAGDAKDITITSSNATGTIQIGNTNDYILSNLTISNSGAGGSITHNAGQTDNGVWDNLIISKRNTENTIFAGTYRNIKGTVNKVLNGSITGLVERSDFEEESCGNIDVGDILISGTIRYCTAKGGSFGTSWDGSCDITGKIHNCIDTGYGYSFGVGYNGTVAPGVGHMIMSGEIYDCFSAGEGSFAYGYSLVTLTISGQMYRCRSGKESFGYNTGNYTVDATLTISGDIDDCHLLDEGYGFGAGGVAVVISGLIRNSTSKRYSFGYSENYVGVVITGRIINCEAQSDSFGCSSEDVDIMGELIDCRTTQSDTDYSSFGNTASTSTGKLTRCSSGGSVLMVFGGTIDNCEFKGDGANPVLRLAENSTVKYSTIVNVGAGEIISSVNDITTVNIKSYHNAYNKVLGVVVTNLIDTPYDVVDSDVTL